jgi:nitroimidazol reductase NimA-like FMN-containing flavoprotein (pyridoxamine 5'-phosphate oxidase superfamily)
MDSITEHGGTDLGRRILQYRYRAGMTRNEAAALAGMAPSYLKYLETSPAPNPTPSALGRLADALGVSASTLAGAALETSPGAQPPVQRPLPESLAPVQCRGYLGAGGVGRMVFAGPRGPEAIPVNYVMLGGDIVVRTGRHTGLVDRAAQTRVSFEVDHLDDSLAEGWSVLASGVAQVVTTPSELETVRSLGLEPWAGGDKDTYLRITVTDMTGRRIRAGR